MSCSLMSIRSVSNVQGCGIIEIFCLSNVHGQVILEKSYLFLKNGASREWECFDFVS